MKDLKDIMNNNRDIVDSFEPSEGHFDRFKNKLEQKNNMRSKKSFTLSIMKYAAVFALLILCSVMTYKYFTTKNMYDERLAYQENAFQYHTPEYQEAGVYFTSEINSKIETIKSFENDSLEQKLLLDELTESDSLFTELQKDLNANPNDERVINAIINHYQTKLKVLNQIIKQLESVKQSKTKYNEEVEV